jgi:hypothetical protein
VAWGTTVSFEYAESGVFLTAYYKPSDLLTYCITSTIKPHYLEAERMKNLGLKHNKFVLKKQELPRVGTR